MKVKKDFYITDIIDITQDLYRNGNASIPRFTNKDGNIRPQDSKITKDPRTGITYVDPSHAGVSASEIFDGGKNRWKIKMGSSIPFGLALAVDLTTAGHVHIVATKRMKQSEYISLLEDMFEKAEKIMNIEAELQSNKNKLIGKRA